MLTGESKPVSKQVGDGVIGGSINAEGSIAVEITKTGADSFLSQVIDLVREAQESKSQTQDLANRAAVWLTYVALGGGAITLLVWKLIVGQDFAFGLERAVTVMVIACPHALGLAVPLVVAVSTSLAAGSGLLIRDRSAFEAARNIDAMIFDKTGTLTEGRFGVTDLLSFDSAWDVAEIQRYAAAVEAHSEHPIAQGIMRAQQDIPAVESFRAPWRGVGSGWSALAICGKRRSPRTIQGWRSLPVRGRRWSLSLSMTCWSGRWPLRTSSARSPWRRSGG